MSVRLNVTSMLHATQVPVKASAKVQMMHGSVVVLQLLCAGMKVARLSAARIIFVTLQPAKRHALATNSLVVVLTGKVNVGSLTARQNVWKILCVKKALFAGQYVQVQKEH
jgi:hypothetical protein